MNDSLKVAWDIINDHLGDPSDKEALAIDIAAALDAVALGSTLVRAAALPSWSIPATAKWCQPGDMQDAQRFMVRFEDRDRGDAIFTNKSEAVEFYKRACVSWNCWLFAAMPVADALLT